MRSCSQTARITPPSLYASAAVCNLAFTSCQSRWLLWDSRGVDLTIGFPEELEKVLALAFPRGGETCCHLSPPMSRHVTALLPPVSPTPHSDRTLPVRGVRSDKCLWQTAVGPHTWCRPCAPVARLAVGVG